MRATRRDTRQSCKYLIVGSRRERYVPLERWNESRATQITSRRNRPVIFRIKSRVSRRAISTRFANDARDVGSFLT